MAFRKHRGGNRRFGMKRFRMRFRRPHFKFRRPRFRFRRPRFGRGFRSPLMVRGLPFSRQINGLMPLAIVVGLLYMFVPAVKHTIDKLFNKHH